MKHTPIDAKGLKGNVPMMITSVPELLEAEASETEGAIESGLVRTQVYGKPEGDGTFKHVYCNGHGNVEHGSMVVLCGLVVLLVG